MDESQMGKPTMNWRAHATAKIHTALREQLWKINGSGFFLLGLYSGDKLEKLVDLRLSRAEGMSAYEGELAVQRAAGLAEVGDRILFDMDPEAPLEIAKVDLWQGGGVGEGTYRRTLTLTHYHPSISPHHWVRFAVLIGADQPSEKD